MLMLEKRSNPSRGWTYASPIVAVILTMILGGIVFAIETELGIPVKLVGLGETAVDLIAFDPSDFVAALFE